MSDAKSISALLDEVRAERARAVARRGGDEVDGARDGFAEWTARVADCAARWMPGRFPPYGNEGIGALRRDAIKVANLALEAVERRQRMNVGIREDPWEAVARVKTQGFAVRPLDVRTHGPLEWTARIVSACGQWASLAGRETEARFQFYMLVAARVALDTAAEIDRQVETRSATES